LQVFDAVSGLYTGTGRNMTDIEGLDAYPIGYGAVSLAAESPLATPGMVDCEVSEWTKLSSCFGGQQTRSRAIVIEPKNGGAACPVLTETISC
jgi:hypothetical protein